MIAPTLVTSLSSDADPSFIKPNLNHPYTEDGHHYHSFPQ